MTATESRTIPDDPLSRGPRRAGVAALLAALLVAGPVAGETIDVAPGKPLDEAIARAKPGDVITLAAGIYAGGVRLPAGVSIRGAGYRQTVVDAGRAATGVAIEGGKGAEVADLTLRGGTTALMARGAAGLVVRRVRASGAITGIRLDDADGGRVEDVLADGNRYGVVVVRGRGVAVVNGTMAGNSGLGLSLASGSGHAAFNNCLAGTSTGIFVGSVEGVRVDHNLYFCLFVGKYREEIGRRSLQDWKYLTGLDAHSAEIPLSFRDSAAGDFRPTGTLGWSQARAATTDWGVAKLGEFAAPERDIDGHPRVGRFDVGAFEVVAEPSRPADGSLVVRSDEGIKSAGIFDREGREVAYLFHNLPLPAGEHPYWFPARDYLGRAIPAGDYQVRSVEADHRWEYLGWVGDTGEGGPAGHTASVGFSKVAFDGAGRLVAAQGWSEDATNVRCFDATTGAIAWTFPGQATSTGLSVGPDGLFYACESGPGWDLFRLDPASGGVVSGPGGRFKANLAVGGGVEGLAVIDGKLFVTDRAANRVRIGPADGSSGLETSVEIPAPTSPAADPTTHVVWVISEGRKVLALGPDGSVVAERDFGKLAPRALAAGHGRLAVATAAEGLVRMLDLPDPKAKAKSGWTLGRGDGPFGPYLPDRFLFQEAPGAPKSHVALALGPKGELAVADQNRLLVFDAGGAYRWGSFGIFGNALTLSHRDPRRFYEGDGRRSLLLEVDPGGKASWRPEAYRDVPVEGRFMGDFDFEGRTFAVIRVVVPGTPFGDFVVVRLDGYHAVPTSAVAYDPKKQRWYSRRDTNGDGRLDASDGGEVIKGPDGKPIAGRLDAPFSTLEPDGTLVTMNTDLDRWGYLWRPSRGPDGGPEYRIEGRRPLRGDRREFVSPYTRKAGPPGPTAICFDPAGGFAANLGVGGNPDGTSLFNNAGTDVAGIDAAGRARWFHVLDRDRGLEGLGAAGPVLITGVGTTAEIINLDRDGLGLGSFSPPVRVHYQGYFLDHPEAVQAYRGPGGKDYALIADNYNGRHHWFRLEGADRIRKATAPAVLSPGAAGALAAMPAPPAYIPSRPPQPVVRIPRLARPLPIDGDLAKWREVGVRPQIVITPESCGGEFDGPADCTAVVRLAYQGNDLYAQFLVFDDVVSFHQDGAVHHQQDGVEICLNGFMTGFKFDVTKTTGEGPIIIRNRFANPKLNWLLPETHAPRSIRVLDNARDVPERDLIESVYGLDLGRSRVMAIEFKLPIDAVTYKDAESELKDITPWGPGREFWLGFLINDNDVPGTNVQNYLLWPSTYNNFVAKEEGARAILE